MASSALKSSEFRTSVRENSTVNFYNKALKLLFLTFFPRTLVLRSKKSFLVFWLQKNNYVKSEIMAIYEISDEI